jgi:hypothetical protein
LHYRNVRFDFSEKEFALFRAAVHQLGMTVERVACEEDYREGDPNFLIQQIFNEPLDEDSDYYANRATLELQRDGTVHFHYRDLRLHFSMEEFAILMSLFVDANAAMADLEIELKDEINESIAAVENPTRMMLPVSRIQPYDEGHRPGVFDKSHRDGIEYCKKLMNEGKKIRPILVDTSGQRLDGFKRYFAHLEFGKDFIKCIVDPNGRMGGQHNQSMIDDDDPVTEKLEPKISKGHRCNDCGHLQWPKTDEAETIRWECEKCHSWNEVEME